MCHLYRQAPAALAALVLLGLALPLPARAQSYYSVYDIGTFGGDTFIYNMNPDGLVIGEAYLPDGTSRAFRLSPVNRLDPAVHDLGTLGGSRSVALDINRHGDVSGLAYLPPAGNLARHAMLFGADGAMQDLGALGSLPAFGGDLSIGFGINDQGDVVGTTADPGNERQHAFLRPAGGPMRDLGGFGGPSATAWDINNAGVIVGFALDSAGVQRAFRHTGSGPLDPATHDLGAFGGAGGFAAHVNEAGVIVGRAELSDGTFHAFRHSGGGLLNAAWKGTSASRR
jgi:probable HAF family extracellular repeat protein